MRALRVTLALVAALVAAGPAAAQYASGDPPLTADQQSRYDTMIHELRCLVCQNETIADSTADLAGDLRNQVRAHIAAGESDAAVTKYLTDRYGEFVLYKPRFTARTFLLWTGPFLLVLLALALVVRRLRREAAPVAPAADPARLDKLLEEER